MNVNKAFIAGNLTRDPETRTLPSGQTVVSFGLATNRAWTDRSGQKQEAVEFHNIVAFGKLADICSRYLNKGRLVLIEGRLQTRSWQGQDGVKRQRTEIIAGNMQMGPRTAAAGSFAKNQDNRQIKDQSKEEIPVIEADEPTIENEEPLNSSDEFSGQNEESLAENEDGERVEVKDIPF